jgi:Nif-specific regulatory protein
LPVDDNLCSRLHALIRWDSRNWHLKDCGSRNGTYLNSRRIDEAILRPGDVIRVGETLIVFAREREPNDRSWHPVRIASSTFVRRIADPERQPFFAEKLAELQKGPARSAAVLCRLAQELHGQNTRDGLVQTLSEALKSGAQADRVTIWLTEPDGRLSAVGSSGSDFPMYASLAIENNEAMLVQNTGLAHLPLEADGGEATVEAQTLDTVISVPIPGHRQRRGAIECVRSSQGGGFTEEDLELVIASSHQAGLALENLEHRERLEEANEQLRARVRNHNHLIGNSPQVRELIETLARVGPVDSTILIQGESGTGKELIARMIHETSKRQAGPYIAVNCAAFSESLLESELFGHEKGAFTGADQRRIGQFERANQGTLFLDEVGELSAGCQARLLRVLERHPFERVGGTVPIHVDVRVVAATHADLPALIQKGRFREDLYFRLRVIKLIIPPLRERGEDVLLLANHFLDHYRKEIGRSFLRFSEEARELLLRHDWPGNVRELKNAIERAVVLSRSEEVQAKDLGLDPREGSAPALGRLMTLAEAELRHIVSVLDQLAGNKTQACRVLGIGRGTLYKKLEEAQAANLYHPSPDSFE